MRPFVLLLLLAAGACDRGAEQRTAAPAPSATDVAISQNASVSKPPALVPMPKDRAEIDRMILAGYTPHADHLHAPGVKECPLAEGSEAVM